MVIFLGVVSPWMKEQVMSIPRANYKPSSPSGDSSESKRRGFLLAGLLTVQETEAPFFLSCIYLNILEYRETFTSKEARSKKPATLTAKL